MLNMADMKQKYSFSVMMCYGKITLLPLDVTTGMLVYPSHSLSVPFVYHLLGCSLDMYCLGKCQFSTFVE